MVLLCIFALVSYWLGKEHLFIELSIAGKFQAVMEAILLAIGQDMGLGIEEYLK
jgi:hypothetical protein